MDCNAREGIDQIRYLKPFALIFICLLVQSATPRPALSSNLLSQPPTSLFLPYIDQSTESAAWISRWGGPIALSPLDELIWVVNPDSGSVTVLNPETETKIVEIDVGGEPWAIAISKQGGSAYVLDRAGGYLLEIDANTYQIMAELKVGAEPMSLVIDHTDQLGYVTLGAESELAVIDLNSFTKQETISLPPHPHGILLAQNRTLYITHFLAQLVEGGEEARDDGKAGLISVIDLKTDPLEAITVSLLANEHGFPNQIAAITSRGDDAWIAHLRASPDLPNELSSTVFAAVSSFNLSQNVENPNAFLPLNDQEIFGSPVNNPTIALPSTDGTHLYIVAAGSDLVEVVEVSDQSAPELVGFIGTGKNPRGMVIHPNGEHGYVMNYLSRSVSIIDLMNHEVVAEVQVTEETLSDDLLQGKILFHNGFDPKIGHGSWISCASCHPDGGHDSVTWMFPDGPRQTPPIWNAQATLPWHWSAALDEMQDVEETIQIIQHGIGLASGTDPAQLGDPMAGRSADLDALALFMASGIRIPSLPDPAEDVSVGRALFIEQGCAQCHGGPNWTTSTLPGPPGTLDPDLNGMIDAVLHDVGTFNQRDVRGASGFDVPSLLNIALTAPYLHDGAAPTLADLLRSGHPTPQLSSTSPSSQLDQDDIDALVVFLKSIRPDTEPIELPLSK